MFGIFRRPAATDLPSFQRPATRVVFRYWNGSQQAVADPIAALRRLQSCEFDPDTDLPAVDAGDQEATGRVVQAIRETFSIDPYSEDGGLARGLTDTEVLALMLAFNAFLASLKKNTSPLPI